MRRSGHIKTPVSQRIFQIFNYIFLTVVISITLYPFWHALMASISSPSRFMRHTGALVLPLGVDFSSYRAVLNNPNISYGFMNTLINMSIGVAAGSILTMFAAYALTRKDFYFKKPLLILMILTMFVSGGLIPMYLTISNLQLLNTRWAVILPVLINTYNVVVTRVFIAGIPDSLEESARLDGANDLVILFRIILPLSIPILSVILLFVAVERWNAWFYPMIFLNKRTLFPVALILREILIANDMSAMTAGVQVADKEPIAGTIKYATVMVTVIPIILVYPFLQKYFIQGMMTGAVKE